MMDLMSHTKPLVVLVSIAIVLAFGAIGSVVLNRDQQQLIPSQADGNTIVLEDTSSKIIYNKTWDTVRNQSNYAPREGSFKQCRRVINADCTAGVAKDSTVYFDKITLGFPTRPNGTSANLLVDGSSVGTVNQTTPSLVGNHTNYRTWTKSLPCGSHSLEIAPNWSTGVNNLAYAIDYIELQRCTPTGNQPTPSPTPSPITDVKCQGNSHAPAKCFSCKKDTPGDQVNILDFTCFAKAYGKQVSN